MKFRSILLLVLACTILIGSSAFAQPFPGDRPEMRPVDMKAFKELRDLRNQLWDLIRKPNLTLEEKEKLLNLQKAFSTKKAALGNVKKPGKGKKGFKRMGPPGKRGMRPWGMGMGPGPMAGMGPCGDAPMGPCAGMGMGMPPRGGAPMGPCGPMKMGPCGGMGMGPGPMGGMPFSPMMGCCPGQSCCTIMICCPCANGMMGHNPMMFGRGACGMHPPMGPFGRRMMAPPPMGRPPLCKCGGEGPCSCQGMSGCKCGFPGKGDCKCGCQAKCNCGGRDVCGGKCICGPDCKCPPKGEGFRPCKGPFGPDCIGCTCGKGKCGGEMKACKGKCSGKNPNCKCPACSKRKSTEGTPVSR